MNVARVSEAIPGDPHIAALMRATLWIASLAMTGPNTNHQGHIMASIHKDIPIDAPAHEVWDAVRDFGALHTRLVPGFVLDTKLDGDVRIVTFANGTVAREQLVGSDDARQRPAYTIARVRVKKHSASVQIVADGEANCRMLWTTDVLPHEIAPYISGQMDQGAAAVQRAFAKAHA